MKNKSVIWSYIFFTYLTFWIMILAIGGTASTLLKSIPNSMQWAVAVCSWAPTFVLLAMSKKILNGMTIKEFYKNAFKDKISIPVFCLVTLIITAVFLIALMLSEFIKDGFVSFKDVSITFPAILWSLFFSVIQGASGEESDWRSYMLPKVTKKYGFVKGNIILGFIWAFWHLPLWFISGYKDMELIQYIVAFIVYVVSFAILMGRIQQMCRNLFLAFWMHFLFNFLLTFLIINPLPIVTISAAVYFVIAVIVVVKALGREKSVNRIHLSKVN